MAGDPIIKADIPEAQLDTLLTPATQLASAGFNAAKTGNIENSVTITNMAHNILDYVTEFTARLDEISKNIAEVNMAFVKGLAQGAVKGLENSGQIIMHPMDFAKNALQHGVQLAHALGEVESLGMLTLNDKTTIEKIVAHGTKFTKSLHEATQQFKALTLTQQAEKTGFFIGQTATETALLEGSYSAFSAASKLAAHKTSTLLGKLGGAEAVVATQKSLLTAEEGLANAIKEKSAEFAAKKSALQAGSSASQAELEAIRQSVFNRTKDLTIEEAHKLGFRAPKIGKLNGFDKTTGRVAYNTEWQGGMEKAKQVFESLKKEFSNKKVVKEVVELKKGVERIFYEFEDGSSIQFRSLGKSGQPKIDIVDTLKNIAEKITFK